MPLSTSISTKRWPTDAITILQIYVHNAALTYKAAAACDEDVVGQLAVSAVGSRF